MRSERVWRQGMERMGHTGLGRDCTGLSCDCTGAGRVSGGVVRRFSAVCGEVFHVSGDFPAVTAFHERITNKMWKTFGPVVHIRFLAGGGNVKSPTSVRASGFGLPPLFLFLQLFRGSGFVQFPQVVLHGVVDAYGELSGQEGIDVVVIHVDFQGAVGEP